MASRSGKPKTAAGPLRLSTTPTLTGSLVWAWASGRPRPAPSAGRARARRPRRRLVRSIMKLSPGGEFLGADSAQAAAHPDRLAAHLVGRRREEEGQGLGDVDGTGMRLHGDAPALALDEVGAERLLHALGEDRAGRDHVDTDAVGAEAARQRL